MDPINDAFCQIHFEIGITEPLTIEPQTILPGEGASDGGHEDPFTLLLLTGGNHGNTLFETKARQIE